MVDTANYESLKGLSHDLGALLFGVARVEALRESFLSLSSQGIERLPYAISLGVHLSDRILEDIQDGPTPLYFFHYQRVNIFLDEVALRITFQIQNQGFDALPIPASQVIDWEGQRGHLSHKHVAKEAGLGWIGRNNLLINPKFGARIRLVTILTDIPLTIDEPIKRDCGRCRNCIPVCPAGAIVKEPLEFDHIGCYEWIKAFCRKHNIRQNICGLCIKVCPGVERP
ncbi:MAG: epoxyqueuosine reductase [Syntrophobacterales bacterium]|nr:MAG: epoxyqueuosine reductase [Syntrophobacterales bacterium]